MAVNERCVMCKNLDDGSVMMHTYTRYKKARKNGEELVLMSDDEIKAHMTEVQSRVPIVEVEEEPMDEIETMDTVVMSVAEGKVEDKVEEKVEPPKQKRKRGPNKNKSVLNKG